MEQPFFPSSSFSRTGSKIRRWFVDAGASTVKRLRFKPGSMMAASLLRANVRSHCAI
jgi:hypothetical protein